MNDVRALVLQIDCELLQPNINHVRRRREQRVDLAFRRLVGDWLDGFACHGVIGAGILWTVLGPCKRLSAP